MTGPAVGEDQRALLVDSLRAAERACAKAQARRAQLMVQLADARKSADQRRCHDLEIDGASPRYKPGEFAAMEIALALTASTPTVQQQIARARRLQAEAPDAWDAWIAGDINEAKAHQISHALRKLERADSKRMLNLVVVAAARPRTPELLRRWLNRFIAWVEPDLADDRIRRSVEDRYVSVRPDLDGVSFLSACLPSLDATSVDLVLDALVGIAEPGDPRTRPQRRADALVDLLLGRISNGWRPHAEPIGSPDPDRDPVVDEEPGQDWDEDDWALPVSAYRLDPTPDDDARAAAAVNSTDTDTDEPVIESRPPAPATAAGGGAPPRISIGVVVSIQSLFGFTDTPGELADGSAHLPADLIRGLAAQPGTLFHRLLTDPAGQLLDVAELGRFPSAKLAAAIRFRDPVCTNPICHTAAARCDLDHVIPWPQGPTAAPNLSPTCRRDHRAKTHAGFGTARTGDQVSWTTPTGHRYTNPADPLPVEPWPPDVADTG